MDGFGRYNAGPDGLGYAPDLDDVLIKRANSKFQNSETGSRVKFLQADMCCCEELENTVPDNLHLLSLFSTSMWLDIHAGDNGFRLILERLAKKTRFFLIEPQPSKW